MTCFTFLGYKIIQQKAVFCGDPKSHQADHITYRQGIIIQVKNISYVKLQLCCPFFRRLKERKLKKKEKEDMKSDKKNFDFKQHQG